MSEASTVSKGMEKILATPDCIEASPVSKGMEKTTEPPEEYSVMSMDTPNLVSPMSWPIIARDSILHWDTIAREATFHAQEKNGLFKKAEIVSDHVAYYQQQDMLPNAVDFIDALHIFEVPLALSNTALSSSLPLVMPLDSSSDIIADVTMTKLKKISSSVYEVAPQLDILQRPIFALTPAQDVAMLLVDSLNSIESLDNGEIGTVMVVSPILDDVDTCGDLDSFVQSTTDELDKAIEDIFMFLEAIDGGNVSLPTEMHSLWDTDPDIEDIHPDYVQVMTDLQDVAIDEFIDAIDGGNVIDQYPSGSRMPFAQWKSLPPEMHSLWDTIPDAERISGYLHKLGSEAIADVSPATPTDEVPVEDILPDPDESSANLRAANGSVASSDHGEKSLVIDPSHLALVGRDTYGSVDSSDHWGEWKPDPCG
jgi:hypothetical protein